MSILTRKEYLENQIQHKESENVGAQVEYELAMSMSLMGKHTQKFEQAMVMMKGRIEANKQAIEIYKRLLEKEK